MFKRTFKVVFRPVRNNFILLPDNYYGLVSTYDTGCLNLQYNASIHYASWAPHAGSVKDTEIGINARVAKELGIRENDLIKCSLIADVAALRQVYVTPVSEKDWEIIELCSENISDSVLEQTRIVNESQILLVWINKSMQVAFTVDRLKPNASYGRLDHNTELIVAPNYYKNTAVNGSKDKQESNETTKVKSRGIGRSSTLAQMRNGHSFDNTNSNSDSHSNGVVAKKPPILVRSTTISEVSEKALDEKASLAAITARKEKYLRLKKDLRRENTRLFEFRVVSGVWREDAFISDVFVSKGNLPGFMDLNAIYCLRTTGEKEYYVKIRLLDDDTEIERNADQQNRVHTLHASIEVNLNLMKILELKEHEKVVLKPKALVVNFVEKLELTATHKKTHYKIIESAFKRCVIENSKTSPMLLNQDQVVRLEEDLMITVSILPGHFRYCAIDSQFLKESKIYATDMVRNMDNVLDVSGVRNETLLSVPDLIKLPEIDSIVERLVTQLKRDICLGSKNAVLRQSNTLIVSPAGTGKTVLVEQVLEQLVQRPYDCYFDIFYCSRSKGRKVESIQKDLRSIMTTCLLNAPSILVLENLDVLAHATGEQATQDAEYFNRIADTIHQLIVQYTSTNAIAVIATASDLDALNKRFYSPRGRHIFQTVIKLPNLQRDGRALMLTELCGHIEHESNDLDILKFANLTEGYNNGDLVQFVERAIFYAYRLSKNRPVLTNEFLIKSLENTNSYCLQGLENHQNLSSDGSSSDITVAVESLPGLETVVNVLEEVLMWPSKYPNIFNTSPLRNQAGVLLYGPPGTGKTFLVAKIAKCWNLRMISVKGPELLAKYIGQSEENVRNLFNRARTAKPCLLFFDEFDSLAPKRGHDSTGVTDRVVNQLLTELDGVEGLQGVTLIAATSRPELLDPALLRSGRIDRLVECPLPDGAARLRIFAMHAAALNLHESVDFEYFIEKTEHYTGADIRSILTTANMAAVKEILAQTENKLPNKIVIKQKHLIEAFNATRPSLNAADVARYKKTYERFTNKEKGASARDFVAKRATLA